MIYHIVPAKAWQATKNQSEFKAPSLETEGFIHCCTKSQIEGVINLYFNDVKELIILHIDPNLTGGILKHELSTGNEYFPHLYRSIPMGAIVSVETIHR